MDLVDMFVFWHWELLAITLSYLPLYLYKHKELPDAELSVVHEAFRPAQQHRILTAQASSFSSQFLLKFTLDDEV